MKSIGIREKTKHTVKLQQATNIHSHFRSIMLLSGVKITVNMDGYL